jgi:hypothetical protein
MAKKRKKQKEEESYEFKMPEFDEEEYLRKEVRETKTLFVTFFYAALIGVVSFALTGLEFALAALVGFIGIVFLRHIYPLLGINTALLEKKQWGTNIIFYIFTWLLIWIILTNPPFSDFQGPNIKNDGVYFEEDGVWIRLTDSNRFNLTSQTNVSINFTVRDNVEVDEDSVKVVTLGNGDEVTHQPLEKIGKHSYAVQINKTNLRQNMQFTIYAKDVNNHETKFEGRFTVNN